MSATIVLPYRIRSPRPSRRDSATPLPVEPVLGPAARLRTALRRVGAAAIAALGFLAGLGWAFFGSLWLGLGASGAADAATAWLWLAGELCIVSGTAAAAWLAATDKKGSSGE